MAKFGFRRRCGNANAICISVLMSKITNLSQSEWIPVSSLHWTIDELSQTAPAPSVYVVPVFG